MNSAKLQIHNQYSSLKLAKLPIRQTSAQWLYSHHQIKKHLVFCFSFISFISSFTIEISLEEQINKAKKYLVTQPLNILSMILEDKAEKR